MDNETHFVCLNCALDEEICSCGDSEYVAVCQHCGNTADECSGED